MLANVARGKDNVLEIKDNKLEALPKDILLPLNKFSEYSLCSGETLSGKYS